MNITAMYATQERMDSIRNWVIMDDAGPLEIDETGFRFTGKDIQLAGTVRNVELVRPRMNWLPGMLYVAAAALFVAFVAFGLLPWSGAPPVWSWTTAGAAVAFGVLIGLLAYWQQVFVRVEADGPDGAFVAYFIHDGRKHGGFPSKVRSEGLANALQGAS